MADHSETVTRLRRLLLDPLVAVLVYPIYYGFAVLPVGVASALGCGLGRLVGMLAPGLSRRALRNIALALPELPPERHREILRGMWENLGRTLAEHPHIDRLWDDVDAGRIEMVGGARFRVTITPPEFVPDTGDREADVLAYMTRINALLESWIRERPEQWLWLHNRWPC